jgi:uncharacterized SAM-binding protein YcdF (DUF218 family)
MHVLKGFLQTGLMPLSLAFALAAIAVVCRLRGLKRVGGWLLGVGFAITYLASTGIVGEALLAPLEHRYLPLHLDATGLPLQYIVVLGTGFLPRDDIPITAAIAEDGLVRIVEGVRIWRILTSARLVVSGGALAGQTPSALGYAILARQLGVAGESLDILDKPLDTNEEARAVANLIGDTRFVLVTSAYHMPRAVELMRRAGLHPIPAPTGQRVGAQPSSWRRIIPNSNGLHCTELALHEYLGFIALAAGIS